MSTVAPVGSWSSTVSLTAGARFRYTATPGAGGSVRMQWTDGTLWFDFGNSAIGTAVTSLIPAAATGIRGQGIGVAGSFDTASADPLYPSYLGNVADESAMTALTSAIIGQTCRRVDLDTLWVLIAQPASTAANWKELASGTADSSFSGSADRTNVVLEADPVNGGYRVYKYTESGLEWTISYDVSGQPVGYSALGGVLSRTISYTSGFGVASGNVFVAGGALSVLTASMDALKAALISLGTAVSQTFFCSDFDSNRGQLFEWNYVNQGFRGPGGAYFCYTFTQNYTSGTNPGTTEKTVFTAVVPTWLRANGAKYVVNGMLDFASNETDTKKWLGYLNTVNYWAQTGIGATINAQDATFAASATSATNVVASSCYSGFGRTNSSSSATEVTIASNTALTFLLVGAFETGGTGSSEIKCYEAELLIRNP